MLKNILKLDGISILSKQQQKFIKGAGSGTCAFESGNGYSGISGVSKEDAMAGAAITGGHWCCDSCGSATWLPQDHKDYLAEM